MMPLMSPPLDLDAIRRRYMRITCLTCESAGRVWHNGQDDWMQCPACKGLKWTNQSAAINDIDALLNEVEHLRSLLASVPLALPANTSTPPATAVTEHRGQCICSRVRKHTLQEPFTLVYEYQDGWEYGKVQTFAEAMEVMRKWELPSNSFNFQTIILTIYDAKGVFVEKSR